MKWTPGEIITLRSPISHFEAASILDRSYDSVEKKRRALKISIPEKRGEPTAKSSVADDLEAKDNAYWLHEHSILSKKYQKLLKEHTVVERLVERIESIAPVSYSPAPAILKGASRRHKGRGQSAVLLFSDTHVGKVTSPGQTLSFGNYNFRVFLARLKYLEEAVLSICKNHVSTEIPELVVAVLGDMLDGALTHSNESGQLDPMFSQFYAAGHAIAQFLRNIAPHFPKVRIYDCVGNHPRFQNQHRVPTKNRFSNFDKLLYAFVGALIQDIPNIKWKLDAQPYQVFDVQGFTFLALHGDTLRGGDKALGIPSHAVGRLVSSTSQMMAKYGKSVPNFYITGHFHRDIVLPHSTGSVMVNGGFPGLDEYGLAEGFSAADPSQKLFMVHPVYGKTASYDISLKFAEVSKVAPYVIPDGFEMH